MKKRRLTIKCFWCNKDKEIIFCQKRERNFCDKSCRMKWQNTVMRALRQAKHTRIIKCSSCGEKRRRQKNRLKWKKSFCNRNCYSEWKKGANSSLWRGGRRIDKDGYVLIHKPKHPKADISNYVREHRLIMEGKLGRYLTGTETVHHTNGNRQDNSLENLVLYNSNSDHLKVHYRKGDLKHLRNYQKRV